MPVTLRIPSLFLMASLLGGCKAGNVFEENHRDLEYSLQSFHSEPLRPEVSRRLNRVLAQTQAEPVDFALQRFYAAFLLAQLHVAASLERPFLHEPSPLPSRIGGIGRPNPLEPRRPSPAAHLVATVYHASYARTMYDRAARSGPEQDGVALVPEELWRMGVEEAYASLQILITVAYSRLGFREEVNEILSHSPDLLEPRRALAFMTRLGLQEKIKPWVCRLSFEYLKNLDELLAYRFGIMAIEGRERFGHALPAAEVAEIEEWILTGSDVLFVCPESQTVYIPGQRRSPISGIPHFEYIPIARQ